MHRKIRFAACLILFLSVIVTCMTMSVFAAVNTDAVSEIKVSYTTGITTAQELNDAVNTITDTNVELSIANDITLNGTLNISGNNQSDVTLNLNGSNLTSNSGNSTPIIDVSGNIDLTITNTGSNSKINSGIGVRLTSGFTGTVTLENLTIDTTNQSIINQSKGTIILRNCTVLASNNKSVTIENLSGGVLMLYDVTLTSPKNGPGVSTSGSGSVTKIYGGTYLKGTGGQSTCISNTSPAQTIIYSGQFNDTTYKSYVASTSTDNGQSGTYYTVVEN